MVRQKLTKVGVWSLIIQLWIVFDVRVSHADLGKASSLINLAKGTQASLALEHKDSADFLRTFCYQPDWTWKVWDLGSISDGDIKAGLTKVADYSEKLKRLKIFLTQSSPSATFDLQDLKLAVRMNHLRTKLTQQEKTSPTKLIELARPICKALNNSVLDNHKPAVEVLTKWLTSMTQFQEVFDAVQSMKIHEDQGIQPVTSIGAGDWMWDKVKPEGMKSLLAWINGLKFEEKVMVWLVSSPYFQSQRFRVRYPGQGVVVSTAVVKDGRVFYLKGGGDYLTHPLTFYKIWLHLIAQEGPEKFNERVLGFFSGASPLSIEFRNADKTEIWRAQGSAEEALHWLTLQMRKFRGQKFGYLGSRDPDKLWLDYNEKGLLGTSVNDLAKKTVGLYRQDTFTKYFQWILESDRYRAVEELVDLYSIFKPEIDRASRNDPDFLPTTIAHLLLGRHKVPDGLTEFFKNNPKLKKQTMDRLRTLKSKESQETVLILSEEEFLRFLKQLKDFKPEEALEYGRQLNDSIETRVKLLFVESDRVKAFNLLWHEVGTIIKVINTSFQKANNANNRGKLKDAEEFKKVYELFGKILKTIISKLSNEVSDSRDFARLFRMIRQEILSSPQLEEGKNAEKFWRLLRIPMPNSKEQVIAAVADAVGSQGTMQRSSDFTSTVKKILEYTDLAKEVIGSGNNGTTSLLNLFPEISNEGSASVFRHSAWAPLLQTKFEINNPFVWIQLKAPLALPGLPAGVNQVWINIVEKRTTASLPMIWSFPKLFDHILMASERNQPQYLFDPIRFFVATTVVPSREKDKVLILSLAQEDVQWMSSIRSRDRVGPQKADELLKPLLEKIPRVETMESPASLLSALSDIGIPATVIKEDTDNVAAEHLKFRSLFINWNIYGRMMSLAGGRPFFHMPVAHGPPEQTQAESDNTFFKYSFYANDNNIEPLMKLFGDMRAYCMRPFCGDYGARMERALSNIPGVETSFTPSDERFNKKKERKQEEHHFIFNDISLGTSL